MPLFSTLLTLLPNRLKHNPFFGLRALRRLLLLVLLAAVGAAPARAQTVDDFQARTFTDAQGHVLPYRLFVPAGYDPARKYPLVLFLHGAGERGDDNRRQLSAQPAPLVFVRPENQAKWPAFMLAPQCPWGQSWNGWPTSEVVDWPLDASVQLVEALQREFPGIDASRLLVTGLSLGGFGTWDALTRYPGKFQKAVPICGGGNPALAPALVNEPIWAFQSADDNAVPVARTREMIGAIRALGGSPRYTEYCSNGLPCYGHFAWDPAYADPDLLPWLFGAPDPASAAASVPVPAPVPVPPAAPVALPVFGSATIVSGGVYKLTHQGTNQCLEVAGNSGAEGANVQQGTDNGQDGQRWVVTVQDDGYYKLRHQGTWMVMEVVSNSSDYGANVRQWVDNGTAAQRWQLAQLADGTYKLVHKGTDQALDVTGNGQGDGVNAQQWTDNGTGAQRWVLTLVSAPPGSSAVKGSSSNSLVAKPSVVAPAPLAARPLTVYPNPATEQLTMQTTLAAPAVATCTLTDPSGQLVRTQTAQPGAEGRVSVRFDVRGLAPGLYLLRVQQPGGPPQTQKVLVQP